MQMEMEMIPEVHKRHDRSTWQKNLVRAAVCAGLLLAALFFFCSAQQAKKDAASVWQNATLVLQTPLSAEDARLLCAEQGDTAFTVWTQKNDQTVSEPDLGRRKRTDVLLFYGAPELAIPMAGALPADDTDGCLIGEQTAWDLFGSTGVVGDEICVGDETKTIRAVLRLPREGVVVIGEDATLFGDEKGAADLRYDRITLASAQAADGQSFLMQNGLNAALLRFDYLCGLGWLTELVPGKWSDFSGWKEKIEQKEEDFALLSAVSKNSPEQYYERQCRRYWLDGMLGAVCVIMAVGGVFLHLSLRRSQDKNFSISKKVPKV